MKNKSEILSYLLILTLIVFHYVTISIYSATPASQSSQDSMVIVDKVIDVIEFVSGNDGVSLDAEAKGFVHHIIRKLAHIILFFIYGFLNMMFSYLVCNRNYLKAVSPAWFMGACGAAFDECLQLFVEGRAGMVSDVFVDMIGVSGACFCFSMMIYFILNEERVFL